MGSIQSCLTRFLLRKSNMWNRPLDEIRQSMAGMKAKGMPDGISAKDEEVNGVPCKVFTCHGGKSDSALLYFHGGGFCMGIYPSNCEFAALISKLAGTDVYMPDYRLSPENPFPAALEDAVAVYKGLLNKGYRGDDLTVMGDSSGCALAVSALLVLKQGGVSMPRALAFITPVFDLAGKGETFLTRAEKDPFELKDPLGIAKIYVGSNNALSPMLSPLYGELQGLPPVRELRASGRRAPRYR
jgi:acetyl esterase/lipase